MEEKLFGIVLKQALATDKCLDGVEKAMDCLIKQAKINKRQKFINTFLWLVMASAVSEVVALKKYIQKQNELIQKLVEVKEEPNQKKGE